MLLPNLAGYNQIWCGGEDVFVSSSSLDASISVENLFTLEDAPITVTLNYDINDLTFYSSACSFQGMLNHMSSKLMNMLNRSTSAIRVFGLYILVGHHCRQYIC